MGARLIAALLISSIGVAGCSDDEEESAGAVDTARAYVEAIDERDGDRFCELVAPYISGTLNLEIEDPESQLHVAGDCGKFISSFIGYIEDCCPPEFVGASVKSAELGERRGRLQAVNLEVELKTNESEVTPEGEREVARTETLRDVVWLAEFDDEWRVAKMSAVAHAASLAFTFGEDSQDDDPLAPPDLGAQLRAYAAEQAEFEERAEQREASYADPGEPAECEGVAIEDRVGDLGEHVRPAPEAPQADLREVELEAEDGDYCLRFTVVGPVEGPVAYSFNLRASASGQGFIQVFYVDLREDGLVRVTSGEDDEDHPIAIPAEVGIAGNELTLVLTPESLDAGEPTPGSTEPPPTDRFVFGAGTIANPRTRRTLNDNLDTADNLDYFAYPSGEECTLSASRTWEPAGC